MAKAEHAQFSDKERPAHKGAEVKQLPKLR